MPFGNKNLLKQIASNEYTNFHISFKDDKLNVDDLKALGKALESNTTLTALEFMFMNIGDEGIEALAESLKINSTVEHLGFANNQIGDKGAGFLADVITENSSVTRIILMQNKIGDEGARSIGKALESNTTLLDIDISYNEITNPASLASSRVLTSLNLNSNKMKLDGIKQLAKGLRSSKNPLETLKLSHNEVGDEGAVALAEALTVNKHLKTLQFDTASIGTAGAKALVAAVSQLEELDIHSNPIGDEGAVALANAMASSKSLKELNFMGISVTDETAKALAQSLKVNQYLKNLNLSYTKITDEGLAALHEAIKSNKTLKFLSTPMLLDRKTGQAIDALLKANRDRNPITPKYPLKKVEPKEVLKVVDTMLAAPLAQQESTPKEKAASKEKAAANDTSNTSKPATSPIGDKIVLGKGDAVLKLKIVRAKGLMVCDVLTRSSDPYARLFLNGTKLGMKTQVKKQTLEPEWNEEFEIPINQDDFDDLTVQLWDHDKIGSNDRMGEVGLTRSTMRQGGNWYRITPQAKEKVSGTLFLELSLEQK